MSRHRYKLVVVGDSVVGKTCLFFRFVKGEFPEEYAPRVFESYVAEVQVDESNIELALWDMAGQDEYADCLRPIAYVDAHVILLTFSVDYPDSLENVQVKWIPELSDHIRNVPIILVGCKKDLRNDEKILKSLARIHQRPISSDEGMVVAAKINAAQYLECSAKTGEGVAEVFEAASRAAMGFRSGKTRMRDHKKVGNSCVVF
ncbi:P-loop containing nucleoside triphosphate hydrolase protein [Flagelloscypha sp. PMI_526]|nr:P-loop containing nucleoside triphosphate hydrolase protein [Flagelloscypha sp. PMI_526]